MYLVFLYLPFTRHYPVSLPLQIPLLVFCSPPQHLLDEEPAGLSTLVALSLVLTWCWLWNDFQRNLGQQLKIWDGSFPSSLLLSKDILLAAPCSQIIRSCWGSFFLQAQLLVLALSSQTVNFRFGPCQGNIFFYRDAQHGAFQKLIPCLQRRS